MKLLTVDVGYIGCKYGLGEDDLRITPSFVRALSEDEDAAGAVLEVDGERYIVGEVAREGKHSSFSNGPRVYDPNTYLLMQHVMGELLEPDDEVIIVTGLPDKEHALFKKEFADRVKQIGRFKYGGVQYDIKISDVQVLKQSRGMFYSQLFTRSGEINDDYANMHVGIAEMGWRTFLLSQYLRAEEMTDYGVTEELGMYHLCKHLADLIFAKYQESYYPEQLEDVLQTGLLPLYGDMEDVSDLIAQCTEAHVEKMLKVFGRQWPNLSKLDAVIFGGGGMQPLYHDYLLPLRQFANNSDLLDRFAVLKGYRRSGLYKLNRQRMVIENGEERSSGGEDSIQCEGDSQVVEQAG